ARREVSDDLARTRSVFEDLQDYRMQLLRAESRVMSDEPRLKAVVATDEVDRATVIGVAREMRRVAGCDLFVVLDASGRLVADTAHPDAEGFDLGKDPLVARAL